MSAVYPKYREKLVDWALNQSAPAGLEFYMVGVDATYVYDAAHNDLADVTGITIAEQLLTNLTYVNGIIDADDIAVEALDTADDLDAFIIYLKDGVGVSYLAAYIDESADGSVPQSIDSTRGVISWHVGGIFR